jgi:hypothetical protein
MLAILVAGMVTTAVILFVIHRIWRLSALEDGEPSSVKPGEGPSNTTD